MLYRLRPLAPDEKRTFFARTIAAGGLAPIFLKLPKIRKKDTTVRPFREELRSAGK
jgi:hypothetical protein